jgi:hypothetical protein
MKIIQINNKHYQECGVVMLPSSEKKLNVTPIAEENNKLFSCYNPNYSYEKAEYQHLYILSNEEIKVGDWCIMLDSVGNVFSNPQQYINPKTQHLNKGLRKVIATTDSSLETFTSKVIKTESGHYGFKTLKPHSIPQHFIEHYINEYNKGNVISRVLVEIDMIAKHERILNDENEPCDKFSPDIHINQNNEISILTEQIMEQRYSTYSPDNKNTESIKDYFVTEIVGKGNSGSLNNETLEEAAECRSHHSEADFIRGAKWQAKQMYSREEVIELLKKARYTNFGSKSIDNWVKENLK